jgi:N-acetylglucosamine-6-phosphate deacetylase
VLLLAGAIVNETRFEQAHRHVALVNGRVILPREIAHDRAVLIKDGTIARVVGVDALADGYPTAQKVDVGGRYVAPGLVDIHIHGATGRTFNEPTTDAFTTITQTCAARGVTSVLATVATAPISETVRCLDFARQWIKGARPGAVVLGVHLEGPYFSMSQKGAQDPAHIQMPADETLEKLLAYRDVIRMMTYAPELPGALALTARLAGLGILPAAGHSAATDQDVLAAMELGLRHTVHIWSGQSSTVREGPWRKPGLLEATLAFDGLSTEMIADNRHLPPTLMKLAYKCKGPDRLCGVSDATSGAGLPEGARFQMGGMEYEVHDGVGMLLDRTAFAGSTTLLSEMVPVLTEVVGIPLVEAVRMATLTPARIIGVADRKGSLEPGKDADIVILEDDLQVWRTMVGGSWVPQDAPATPLLRKPDTG